MTLLRETILQRGTLTLNGRLSLLTVKHSGSYARNYKKASKKATYYVNEIEEKLNFKVTQDLRLAYKRIICDINKALEDSANGVKDAMLDAETSFAEVRKWSNTHKQYFIPVRHLRVIN